MTPEQNEKYEKIAPDVLRLARNTLTVNLRFMSEALNGFKHFPLPINGCLTTDGRDIGFNTLNLLKNYKAEKELPVRDLLHLTLHCVFRHFFVGSLVDRECWDLACDIAVENMINELNIAATRSSRQLKQREVIEGLKKEVRHLTAEVLYKYFLDLKLNNRQIQIVRELFEGDEHDIWYEWQLIVQYGQSPGGLQSDNAPQNPHNPQNGGGDDDDDGGEGSREDKFAEAQSDVLKSWKEISERIQTDLETFARQHGDAAGSLTQNLKEVNRERYDYTEFLKKFSVLGEAMKVNDDEFDYIFYTYGLKLYDKMPLVEPLEYKDIKKIREFVIAIDTSGSVSGELVQKFVQKTYNILKNEESYFRKINLHIIQCDAKIQEDVKITSQEEFDEYLKTMKLRGFGGTDFRPVFNYVDKLIEQREFVNLKGLIYFTDGYGTFPEKQPPYNTAFVYVGDEYDYPDVPVWAIKLVLQSDEI